MTRPSIPSTINEVIVYKQGALIQRIATLPKTKGSFPEHILLIGLPPCLIDESVRIKIAPQPKVNVPVASDLKVELQVKVKNPDLSPAEISREKLKSLQNDLTEKQEHLTAVSASINRLNKLQIPNRPTPEDAIQPMPSPTKSSFDLIVFIRKQQDVLELQKNELLDEIQEIKEQIHHYEFAIQQEYQEPEINESDLTKTIATRLTDIDSKADTIQILLEYLVPGARWTPEYSLHIDSEQESGELEMRALVAQASGENWENVNLKLSTALPVQWTDLPELHSLRIGRQQSLPEKRGWREPPQGADSLFSDYDAFFEDVERYRQKKETQDPIVELVGESIPESIEDLMGEEECLMEEIPTPATSPAKLEVKQSRSPKISLGLDLSGIASKVKSKKSAMSGKSAEMASEMNTEGGSLPGQPESMTTDAFYSENLMNYQQLKMAYPRNSRRGQLEVSTSKEYGSVPNGAITALEKVNSIALELPSFPAHYSQPYAVSHFDYTYVCKSTIDIPSKQKYNTIPVCKQPIKTSIRYVVVPREAQDVFRVAIIENPMNTPLLPGPIDLYLNGNFFITSHINVVSPKGKVDLGFGVEQSIKIARNTYFEEESEGILKGKLLLKHKINLEAINNLKKDIKLEVRERIPVKQEKDEDIEILLKKVEPDWIDYNESRPNLRGRYTWKVEIPAGKKQKFTVDYDIQIASKNELTGGNRREV